MTTRLARLLGLRVRNQFLDWASSWTFAATLAVNYAIGPLIGLVVWTSVLPGDRNTLNYFVALVGVYLVTASFEDYTFSEAVYDGRVSHDLLKPQPVIIGPAGENIAIRLWLGLFGLPLTIVVAIVAGASYRPSALLLAVPALLGAAIVRFLWTWLLALTAFWTERVHAIVAFSHILAYLLGGTAAPIADLPEPWRSIALALPFYAMLGLPADIATGAPVGAGYLLLLGWGSLFAGLAAVVWRRGIRRYSVVGA
ncbi:ABC-2 family transporter protein [Kutzneria sp. NPDC051319]|uniref:ABC-2 family transporter protein n=1 Tax=Kutzneria sp. NPDC051319 TaxID=3155047 RepID=UPI003432E81E